MFSREVDLIFTVTDRRGHFVTGLAQQDFGLLDDGRPPSHVVSFKQQTNLPLRVGIMLDTSTSIRQRFQFEQQAATDFLLQVLRPEDRAFVEGFDVQTELSQDFTNRVDLLDTGIRKLRPGGGTALFDSLYKTCRDQMLTLQQTNAVRKAIVLVSDGDDDYSRAYESDAIKMCQRCRDDCLHHQHELWPEQGQGRRRAEGDCRRDRRPGVLPGLRGAGGDWASTALRRRCAASTRWCMCRRTSSRMAASGPSICRR